MAVRHINCLWFDHGEARKAAEFYTSLFSNSRIGRTMLAPTDFPGGGKEGSELTVEFTVMGVEYMGLNGGPEFKPNESVSFMIETEDQDETDRYCNAIVGNGGEKVSAVGAKIAGVSPGRSRRASSTKAPPILTLPFANACSRP